MKRLLLIIPLLLVALLPTESNPENVSAAQACAQIVRPTITPTSFNFGTIPIGQSASFTLNISVPPNPTGGAEIFYVKSHNPAFVVTTSIRNVCLPGGGSVSTDIQFNPKTTDTISSTIEISHTGHSDDPPELKSFVNVRGKGQGVAAISVSPSSLDFGTVSINQTSDRSFTVKNTGTLADTISKISTNNPAFAITSPALPKAVPPGGSFSVNVRFSPKSSAKFNGQATVSDASGVVGTVGLFGAGGGNPSILVLPTQLDFGQMDDGTFVDRTLTIKNNGQGILSIQSLVFSDPLLKISPIAPQNIAPNGSLPFKVRYESSILGAQSRSLTIHSNDQTHPSVVVPLTANVVAGRFGFIDRSASSHIASSPVHAHGVQWIDYNNDNKLDLYICGENGNALFKNIGGGKFTNVTAATHTGNNGRNCHGATWADVDNDGDLDVFIANSPGPSVLLRNNHGVFSATTAAPSTLSSQTEPDVVAAIFLDFNNDGKVDLFEVRNGAPNRLMKGIGFFQFVDVALSAHVDFKGPGRAVVSADINGDGYPDLYVVNFNAPNKLYLNNKNETFKDISVSSGTSFNGGSVEAVFADYNGDGRPDLFVVNSEGSSALYRNQGNNKFVNVTAAAGLTGPQKATSASFADYDNDGKPDLIITQSTGVNLLFKNSGGGRFANAGNVDLGHSNDPTSSSTGDSDNDGTSDPAIGDGGGSGGSNSAYENSGGTGNHHLTIVLHGTSSNRSAIGAAVIVTAVGIIQGQTVSGGTGSSQDSIPLEFGLGNNTTANILVTWPGGKTQSQTNVAADTVLTITEEP